MPKDLPQSAAHPVSGFAGSSPKDAASGKLLPAYETLYAKLVNSIGGIVWEADGKSFQFSFVSPQAEVILGYPTWQWLSEPAFWRNHTHPDDVQWCTEFCLEATSRRQDHSFKYRMIAADGRVVWLHDIVTVQVETDDSVRLRGIMIDITGRVLADEALRESEILSRATFERSGSGIALVDMQGYPIECNPALLSMLGYSQDEMRRRRMGEFTFSDDHDVDFRLYQDLLNGKREKYEIEKRFVTKTGDVIWGNLIVSLIRDENGTPKYAIDILQDITERKNTELELRRVTERLQLATRVAGIGIWDWDVVKDELHWDDTMYELFGVRKDEFIGGYRTWARALAPEDLERAESEVQASLRGEREFASEFRVVWPDGSAHIMKAASETFRDDRGSPVRMVGVNYDVTKRRLAEEKLRWSEEQLRLLLDSTAEGIFGVDLAGRCTFCNVASLRLLGWEDPAELLGQNMHTLVAHSRSDGTPYPMEECPAVNSLKTASRAFASGDVFWRKDGTQFPAEYWSFPMFREGEHIGAVVTFLDVTERRSAEESLRASEERFSKAFQVSPEPISIFRNDTGVLIEVNERWSSVYGYSRAEALGRTAVELNMIAKGDRDRLRTLLDEVPSVRDVKVDLRTKRGDIRHISLTSERIVIGSEVCNIFLHRDITDQVRAEAENRQLIRELGERVKELTALHETARILQDEAKSTPDLLQEIVAWLPVSWQHSEVAAGRISWGEFELKTPNFSDSQWSQTAEFTAAGVDGLIEVVYLEERPEAFAGPFLREERTLIDSLAELISASLNRKHAQEAMRESEERVRQLTDNVREVLWLYTPDFERALYISPAYETVWGRPRESLYADAHSFLEAVHPADRERVKQVAAQARERSFDHEYRIVRPDGAERWIWDRGFHIKDDSGTVYRLAGIAEDITDRKQAEERLRSSREQLRALSEGLRRAKEEEGIRIARELHDELGSALTTLKWSLLGLERPQGKNAGPAAVPELKDKINEMVSLVDNTINTVRRISSELRPSVLDDLGLISAIEWHAQQFQTHSGIACRFESSVEQVPLDRDQATAVFRIFQEGMTNVLRHAQATKVQVLIEEEEGEFILELTDNGRGITESQRSGINSLGLLGMRERAHAIGAVVEIKRAARNGTTVVVRLPPGAI